MRSCIEHLEKTALDIEGIFRRTTAQSIVKQSKLRFNEGIDTNSSYSRVHHLIQCSILPSFCYFGFHDFTKLITFRCINSSNFSSAIHQLFLPLNYVIIVFIVVIGKEVDLDEPHLAAVLLKQFLRELPEPVLMYSTYSKLKGFKGINKSP